jgi:hypothetical protein
VRLAERIDPIRAQGLYYVATGTWPIVHLRSFMALTGRKRETWLVQTFGLLVAALGAALLADGDRPAAGSTVRFAVAPALALAVAEVAFVTRGRIRPIYLVDTAIEVALVAATLQKALRVDVDRPGRPRVAAQDGVRVGAP